MDASMDLLQQLKTRIKNAELAVQDMPAPAEDVLKTLHEMTQSLQPIEMSLSGDRSLAGREFETVPSVGDRISTVMYSIWNTTSEIPATHVQSLNIAIRQMETLTPKLKEADAKLKVLESELTAKGAPYTPGRW
jgi:aspartokinase